MPTHRWATTVMGICRSSCHTKATPFSIDSEMRFERRPRRSLRIFRRDLRKSGLVWTTCCNRYVLNGEIVGGSDAHCPWCDLGVWQVTSV